MQCRVLVVDDDKALQYTFRELLTRNGYSVVVTGDPFEALKLLPEADPHIAILDLSMPKMNGLELLVKLKQLRPSLITLMITAHGSQEIAVKAIKSGADDYFPKPFSNELMLCTLENARRRLNLELENQSLRQDTRRLPAASLLGESPPMEEIRQIVGQIAPTDVTVLIQGESGTGKEVLATALFEGSRRRDRPFIKLNCAALPESLIESELFGYEVGAFTGAAETRRGKFELADTGTVFLDEIGDMSNATQTKVLRVLQEREVERIGGRRANRVDVRVITATNQDLEARIAEGRFRMDLYYRLNVVRIEMPPLRQRRDDIPMLARHFLELHRVRFGRPPLELPQRVLDRMMTYDWPGNVRELENGIARAVVLDNPDLIVGPGGPARQAEDELMGDIRALTALSYKEAKARILERFERYYLLALMEGVGHNVSQAARLARMDRKNFWVKVKPYLPEREGRARVRDSGFFNLEGPEGVDEDAGD